MAELPDDFVVVNDVRLGFGNIDHVVIGPTGVHVIDAKNWAGSGQPNGQGDLLLNGRPFSKPEVKTLLAPVMDFHGSVHIESFCSNDDQIRPSVGLTLKTSTWSACTRFADGGGGSYTIFGKVNPRRIAVTGPLARKRFLCPL